jgi:hypothetical protein
MDQLDLDHGVLNDDDDDDDTLIGLCSDVISTEEVI